MGFPNIPDITPSITITRTDVINLLLASIAMEEIGLSHIINAEGEKIQAGIDLAATVQDLVDLDDSVRKTLQDIIKKEMLLQFKLENVLEVPEPDTPTQP